MGHQDKGVMTSRFSDFFWTANDRARFEGLYHQHQIHKWKWCMEPKEDACGCDGKPVKSDDFQEVGCYKEDPKNRLLPILLYPGAAYSANAQDLAKLCYKEIQNSGKKYPIFAIQDNQCYTTEKPDTYDDKGKSKDCVCQKGGKDAMTVFKVVKDPGQPEFEPLGCYGDNPYARALPDLVSNEGPGMTPSMCYEAVKKTGINYARFGVQAGRECWAGKKPNCYSRHGKSNKCKSGRGGGWANSVYKIKEYKEPNTDFELVGCWKTNDHRQGVFPKMVKADYSKWFSVGPKICAQLIRNHCDDKISGSIFFGSGVSLLISTHHLVSNLDH